jgi:DNA primase large subunit
MGDSILPTKVDMATYLPTEADMAKYPFLPRTKEYIARLGIDLAELVELPPIRNRAKGRIYATFDLAAYYSQEPSKRLDIEIVSFPVAILYVGGTRDSALAERFALFEAKQISEYLEKEKDDIILGIAKSFKWDIYRCSKRERIDTGYPFTIYFVHYLINASRGRLVHDTKWKLANRLLDNGQVYVTKEEVCRLLQEEIREYIEERTNAEFGKIPSPIQDDIDEIKAKFVQMKPHLEEFDQIISAEESEYPPCVKNLFDRATKGQHLSHVERFTLVTYLIHQGISVDAIVKLFSNLSDFREDKTRYQVEHLAGQRGSRAAYTTYNCSTLQTHGVCTNPDDPICRSIRNPLTYHLKKHKY